MSSPDRPGPYERKITVPKTPRFVFFDEILKQVQDDKSDEVVKSRKRLMIVIPAKVPLSSGILSKT